MQSRRSTVVVVQRLMEYVATLEVQGKHLLLDRGFAGIDVQDYLDEQKIPAIIACPIRGKTGGTRALCRGRKSYRTHHTFSSQGGKKQRTAQVAICRTYTTTKRTKRLKRRATWQVFILIRLEMQPQQVCQRYRYRFGIEAQQRPVIDAAGMAPGNGAIVAFGKSKDGQPVLRVNIGSIARVAGFGGPDRFIVLLRGLPDRLIVFWVGGPPGVVGNGYGTLAQGFIGQPGFNPAHIARRRVQIRRMQHHIFQTQKGPQPWIASHTQDLHCRS